MTAKEVAEDQRKFEEAGSTPPFLYDGYPPEWLQRNGTASESDPFDELIIPGTYYTLAWRRRVGGMGSTPGTGDSVRVIFRGHLVAVPDSTVREGTLAFVIGDSLVGPGIQAAVKLVRTGAVHDIELREEVAKGIREAWADLPPRSRLRLVLRRQ